MSKRLSRVKRRAAVHICLFLFHSSDQIVFMLRKVASTNPNFDADLGDGLTEKERTFVRKLAKNQARQSALLRRLAHHLQQDL